MLKVIEIIYTINYRLTRWIGRTTLIFGQHNCIGMSLYSCAKCIARIRFTSDQLILNVSHSCWVTSHESLELEHSYYKTPAPLTHFKMIHTPQGAYALGHMSCSLWLRQLYNRWWHLVINILLTSGWPNEYTRRCLWYCAICTFDKWLRSWAQTCIKWYTRSWVAGKMRNLTGYTQLRWMAFWGEEA